MDEATSSIDIVSEKSIQILMQEEFKNCTVVIIAHRLKTVIDTCDRIMVLEEGKLKEMDTPHNLLNDVNSAFYAMV